MYIIITISFIGIFIFCLAFIKYANKKLNQTIHIIVQKIEDYLVKIFGTGSGQSGFSHFGPSSSGSSKGPGGGGSNNLPVSLQNQKDDKSKDDGDKSSTTRLNYDNFSKEELKKLVLEKISQEKLDKAIKDALEESSPKPIPPKDFALENLKNKFARHSMSIGSLISHEEYSTDLLADYLRAAKSKHHTYLRHTSM